MSRSGRLSTDFSRYHFAICKIASGLVNLPPSSAARTIPPDGLTFSTAKPRKGRALYLGRTTIPRLSSVSGCSIRNKPPENPRWSLAAGSAPPPRNTRGGVFALPGSTFPRPPFAMPESASPHFRVDYQTADLPHPPAPWRGQFDFVFETNTLQVLPAALRPEATRNIAAFLRPGGHLLLIARHREASDPEGEMPWPSRVRKFPPSPLTVSRKSCSTFFLMSASRTSAVFASFSAGRDLRAPPQCSAASTLRNAITAATNSSDFSSGGTCPHLSKVISFAPAIPAA